MSTLKVNLEGFCGRDAEEFYTKSNKQMIKFSVAVTPNQSKEILSSEEQDHTIWFNVLTFKESLIETAIGIEKGDKVLIEGNLSLNKYTQKETGKECMSHNLIPYFIQILRKKSDRTPFSTYEDDKKTLEFISEKVKEIGEEKKNNKIIDKTVSDDEAPF